MPTLTQTTAIPLSELTTQIEEAIQGSFFQRSHWVLADVSNHTFYPNKDHHYFELVEKGEGGIVAKMQAVAWRPGAVRIALFQETTKQRFTSGIRVCVKVMVEYHSAYGLKLVVLDVDPSYTLGQIELQRLATINRLLSECSSFIQLSGERFVTKNNQLKHQRVIQRIAILSSSSSAGYQDFMKALVHNEYGYRFDFNTYFTTVQGEANADGAKQKLAEICASGIAFDAVVIIRGGGADTDFLLFDQYVLCASVAALHIPVITGIGHTKNRSLVDMLSHTATISPTEAAKFIVAHNLAFERALVEEQNRIIIKAQQRVASENQIVLSLNASIARKARALVVHTKEKQVAIKQRIIQSTSKLSFHQQSLLTETAYKIGSLPKSTLAGKLQTVDATGEKISWLATKFLENQQKQIRHYETLCRMMSPINILKKGFALVYKGERIVTNAEGLAEGEMVKVRLLNTELQTTVIQKQSTDGDTFNL